MLAGEKAPVVSSSLQRVGEALAIYYEPIRHGSDRSRSIRIEIDDPIPDEERWQFAETVDEDDIRDRFQPVRWKRDLDDVIATCASSSRRDRTVRPDCRPGGLALPIEDEENHTGWNRGCELVKGPPERGPRVCPLRL